MGRGSYCSSHMEASSCTFGFGVIIRHDLRTLALPHDSQRDLSSCRKGNSCLTNHLASLATQKIRRYNNSPSYVTARWPPQQIPSLNFLGRNPSLMHDQGFSHKLLCKLKQHVCSTTEYTFYITWNPVLRWDKWAGVYVVYVQIYHHLGVYSQLKTKEKVYLKSQILVHEYWTILDHFCIPVL